MSSENSASRSPVPVALTRFGKGAVIGASMLIPGVSGGSTAVLLRIYDELVSAVSTFFSQPKKSLLTLLPVAVGGALGMYFLSKPLLTVMERFPAPMACLLTGILLGSVPSILKGTSRKDRLSAGIFAVIGLLIALGLAVLPQGLFQVNTSSLIGCITLFFLGFPLALALVLPGISVSYMLLVFSLYQPFLQAIHSLSLSFLLPLAGGIGAGTLLLTGLLESLGKRFPPQRNGIIAGFLLGSLPALWAEIALPRQWTTLVICIALFIGGFLSIYFLSSKE